MDPSRIHDAFPAPEYRDAQEQAQVGVQDAFAVGNEVVLIRAPTAGSDYSALVTESAIS